MPSNDTRALLEDRDGAIWIGTTGGGLARLVNDRIQHFGPSDGLSDSTVLVLAADKEDSVWIGTLAGGLNRLRAVPFSAITRLDGLPTDDVLSVYEDRAGRTWIGTDGGGLTRFKPGDPTITYTTEDGLPSNYIRTTWQAADGSLWVGTGDRGLARYADGEWTSLREPAGDAAGRDQGDLSGSQRLALDRQPRRPAPHPRRRDHHVHHARRGCRRITFPRFRKTPKARSGSGRSKAA